MGIGPAAPIARIVPVSRAVTDPDALPGAIYEVMRELLVEGLR